MAAVMTVKIGRHTATFYDDAYINCTEEEIEARKQQARIVAEGIYARAALREKQALSAAAGAASALPEGEPR